MLSHWVRKLMTAMLLALLVGWWMPKIINPPRMLPIPIKDFIDAYAPPHLDPGAKNRKNMHMIKSCHQLNLLGKQHAITKNIPAHITNTQNSKRRFLTI